MNIRHPQRDQKQRHERQRLWTPNPIRIKTSAINSHFWLCGPTQGGKTYFVQQILKHNGIVYEEQKSIRIFWYYNQWQECYEDLKTPLGKSIRFERGVPELSEDLCEINAWYNNIIILTIWWLKRQTVLWYLDCLRKVAIETTALSYYYKTCFL